jgi:hypothetical protein
MSIEIPPAVKRRPGLDSERSWAVVDELKEFAWPGYDLQANVNGQIAYDVIPQRLYDRIRRMVLDCAGAGRLGRVPR